MVVWQSDYSISDHRCHSLISSFLKEYVICIKGDWHSLGTQDILRYVLGWLFYLHTWMRKLRLCNSKRVGYGVMKQGFKQKSSFKIFTVFLNCITFCRIKKKKKKNTYKLKYRLVVFCLDGRKNFGQLESFNNERTTFNTLSSVSLKTFKLKLRDYIWRWCYRNDSYPWWIVEIRNFLFPSMS